MSLCRKFISCSAPQCPIDKPSLSKPYYSGERICVWLLEYPKKGSKRNLQDAMGGIPLRSIAEAYEILFSSNGTIRGRLVRAMNTPSRLTAKKSLFKQTDEFKKGGL